MADVHLYFGLEVLSLTAPQKATLVANLQALGQRNGGLPNERNHWRLRPDDDAVIFEAVFSEDNLTADSMKTWLASIFGVAVGTISHNLTTPTFGTRPSQVLTFTYNSIQRIRSVVFGSVRIDDVLTTYEESHAEALAYLAANAAAWGDA